MVKKKKIGKNQSAILNRRASFDYALGEDLIVGMELTGPEVRSARDGHIQLKGSFVTTRDEQLWLNNASFTLRLNEKGVSNARTVDTRARRLLATKKQIQDFMASKQSGMSIVPLKLLNRGKYIKLVIAVGKGKKHYDKRETLKRRDQERESQRAMK